MALPQRWLAQHKTSQSTARCSQGQLPDRRTGGLANWIDDAMRARVLAEFDGMTEVSFSEQEPHFDVFVTTPERIVFRIRCKRHSGTGRIANYRTQGALDFVTQPDDLLSLAGVRFVHLCVGYEWDADSRSMTGAVVNSRDGSFDDVVLRTDPKSRTR